MNNCRKLREALGLTMNEMARKINMANSTLKLYENGGSVTDRTISKLTEFFGVTKKQLEGISAIDIKAWVEAKKGCPAPEKAEQPKMNEPLRLHQLGIKQVIKTSHSAVSHYLKEGWILLDTMPMKEEDDGFFCLIGNPDIWSQEDFERVKRKNTKHPQSYWLNER